MLLRAIQTPKIKHRELTAMITAITMSFALVLVAAIGLNQTNKMITELESRSLPNIRIGLSLAEGVAQVAAFAPYVASINQPSLLDEQNSRLQKRFNDLFSVTQSITDLKVRNALMVRLVSIQSSTKQLTEAIKRNLFLSEELISRRYQLKFAARDQQSHSPTSQQELDLLAQLLVSSDSLPIETIDELAKRLTSQGQITEREVQDFLSFAHANAAKTQENNRQKQYLLVSIRVQSEYLSNYVNDYVNQIQKQVYSQQTKVQLLNNQVFWGMVVMMVLLIVAVFANYGINVKVVQDLTTVTDDMVRLSVGDTTQTSQLKTRNDEIGALLNAYQVFRDYTYKIQTASANIEQQKQLLESIFDGMHDGLSVFSEHNALIAWNKQYLACLGLSDGDIRLGMPLDEILTIISGPDVTYKDIHGNSIELPQQTASRHYQELCFERHDASGRIIEFRSKPMGHGGFITLTQDLTYRRETELQLQQAVKMDGLGQLTGGVSHDFNNFLTSILGNLQMLELQGSLDNSGKKYLERALRATESGRGLVKKLLAFSRKQILEPEILCVENLILETQDLLQYSLNDGVSLKLDLDATRNFIKIDKVQLQNALLNLTINSNGAIQGTGSITISTQTIKHRESTWLRLSVSDNGKGIPVSIQHRVFEAFFTTKPMGAGSGLGLASVHGYVVQSGGEIGIESQPNAGTTIWMQWPLSHPVSPSTANSPMLPQKITGMLTLIEDDEQVAETMVDMLSHHFSEVVHFTQADVAQTWIENNANRITAVLSDVHLASESSGVSLKRALNQTLPSLPVFLYSGMAKEAIEQQFCVELGDEFMNKPIAFSDIAQLLTQHNIRT